MRIDIFEDKHAWDHLEEKGEGIRKVLQDVPSDEKAALAAWDKHLRQVVSFPFQAEVNEFQEKGPQPS